MKFLCLIFGLASLAACAFDYTLIEYSEQMVATGTSQINAERGYVHAIDGSGLTELEDGEFGHTAAYVGNMWMTASATLSESAPKFYCVDLGAVYNLGKIKIWNFNMSGQATRGFKATEIYVTDAEDAAKSSPADIRAWGYPVWQGELSKATGAANDPGCEPIVFGLPKKARHVGFVVTSSHGDTGYQGLSEVRFYAAPEGVPGIVGSSVGVNASGDGFAVSAQLDASSYASEMAALAFASDEGEAVRTVLGTAEPGAAVSGELSNLAADTTYAVVFEAGNEVATVTNDLSAASYVYNGALTLAFKADGEEKGTVPAQLMVSRAAADPYPLTVNYTLSPGDAVAGVDYVAPSGTVTIPAGETSAVIEIFPIVNPDRTSDFSMDVALASGLYFGGGVISVTIHNAEIPSDANVWIAGSSSDGLASTAANWSKGVPRADNPESLVIRIDGDFSSHDLTWDADGENGLAQTVSSWKQTQSYGGTVTFKTTFPVAASPFKLFTVDGEMDIDGGTITHPVSVNWDNNGSKTLTLVTLRADYIYRLAIKAGSLRLGEGAKISAAGKGHSWRRVTSNVKSCAPSHGGRYETTAIGCYGNPKYPEDVGLASNVGTDSLSKSAVGGGAVKLTVEGECRIDGEISVDGTVSSGYSAAGAAGSVLIEANRVIGSGVIHADGIYCGNTGQYNGTGGRIALLTDAAVDTSALTVRAGGSSSGKYAPEGTVYLKDATMTHGILLVDNPLNTNSGATSGRGSYVTKEEGVDWTFDAVRMNGHINLYVPAGATLTLPNGFASITAPANASRCSGLYYLGGTIDAGEGDQTLSGNWYFAPVAEYVFPANVSLENGAYVGFCGYYEQTLAYGAAPATNVVYTIRCTVTGDMTVASGCGFTTQEAGAVQQSGQQYAGVPIGNHGGRNSAAGTTMDSVFDPILSGVGQSNSYSYMKPGAAMIVKVGGKLTLDGVANANPVNSQGGGFQLAAGGSINFTVGELAGSGTFAARGFRDKQNGGRIAVRLTKPGTTFSDFTGVFNVSTADGAANATPGSVYLETAAEADRRGTVYLDNRGTKTTTLSVPICANGYGADEVADFKNAALVVRGGAYAQVTVADENGGFKLRELTVEENSKLDLYGHRLVVKAAKLGGTRLPPGLYNAADEAVAAFVADTVGNGTLKVEGRGIAVLVR
ncbi:MAG: hypothetical protein ACI4R9_05750 [Kiritimatiellia bacterium]